MTTATGLSAVGKQKELNLINQPTLSVTLLKLLSKSEVVQGKKERMLK